MALELSGKLVQILPVQTGTGKNGPWKKVEFIVETMDKFPKKICITAWKEQADQAEKLAINSTVKLSLDLSSREFNGKWYSEIKAWKIAAGEGGSATEYDQEPPQDYSQDTFSEEPPF